MKGLDQDLGIEEREGNVIEEDFVRSQQVDIANLFLITGFQVLGPLLGV
jgi:hypothetical protein